MLEMFLEVLAIIGNLGVVVLQPELGWIDYKPVKSIGLELPEPESRSVWTVLNELDYEQAGTMTVYMKTSLKSFRSKYSYMLAKGSHVISKHSIKGIKLDSFFDFPYGNSLALLSFNLKILLEGLKPAVLYEPMENSLQVKDRSNPVLKHQKENSLYNLLSSLDNAHLARVSGMIVKDLEKLGEEAITFTNTVLGKSRDEAWLDSFYALGIEESPMTTSGQIQMRFNRVLSYSLAVMHELKSIKPATTTKHLPTANHHYLFGWFINCPRSLDSCMYPRLPKDLLISASSSLRIYLVPSLELTLIVRSVKKATEKSLEDLIDGDNIVWTEIITFLETIGGTSDRHPEASVSSSNENNSEDTSKDAVVDENDPEDPMVKLIHQIWPVLVFVFWVVSSHVWVYWMLHCCWIMATYASKRTHTPRPKSGAGQ